MKRPLLALLLCLTACSSNDDQPRRTTVTVFAAASLSKAFVAEQKAFETAHPAVRLRFSFAGSQALVAQIKQGAPADVLATADVASMQAARPGQPPVVFAHNRLAIITAPGNPLGVKTLRDLARPGLKVVLGGPTVPVGKATAKALRAAGVSVQPVSLEDAVTGVVGKVRLGEADAGVAYVSDLAAAGRSLAGVPIEGSRTELAIAPLKATGDSFVAFVLSAEGQRILRSYGFQ